MIDTKTDAMMKITREELVNYYDECWLNRFGSGHNPLSLAMHMGYFTDSITDNDLAKLNTNHFLTNYVKIPVQKEVFIADFGCGVGGTCLHLAQHFPLAKITGVNISPSQIEFADKAKLQKANAQNIKYLVADYADTSLPASFFDYVIGIESICHAEDKLKVYEEAYRILKPGGTFVFLDYFETTDEQISGQQEILADFRKGWAVDTYINNYEADLAQAGFSRVNADSITAAVLPGIDYSWQKASKKIHSLSGQQSATYLNHLKACIALKNLVDNKVIDYKILTAVK